jgi:hypothetical protein
LSFEPLDPVTVTPRLRLHDARLPKPAGTHYAVDITVPAQ